MMREEVNVCYAFAVEVRPGHGSVELPHLAIRVEDADPEDGAHFGLEALA